MAVEGRISGKMRRGSWLPAMNSSLYAQRRRSYTPEPEA
jgi:hypothetical protein